ncbi:MAG: Gfo/Idh/MocA family oxidoreductase [Acidobacteria bacterium]|nr:Gfo/Idh/MocA family oxidoreductase [Acidobacteriota bacterium]
MNREVNIALIGQGFMGRAHSNAYRQVKHFFDIPVDLRLKVICGRNRPGLETMARAWGWEQISTDWRSVVERPDVDLVDVSTPNALHAPIAIAAARAGKMVLCEKPLATSVAEATSMVEAARGAPNGVWFNYRRIPAVAFSRRLIDEGRVGEVFHYRAVYLQEWGNDASRPPSWKLERAHAGSGVLGDLLSHLVDTALYLNGPIREVSGLMHTFAPRRDIDDATLLLARFANGSVGSFEATRYAVGRRNCNAYQIHGSRGMLAFNLEDMNYLELADATEPRNLQGPRRMMVTGPDQPYSNNFWRPGHSIGYEHTFIATLADFLLAPESFRPNFADALEVERVLEAVAQSARERRAVSPAGLPL